MGGCLDFDRHNKEQADVWQAFWEGDPIRVPVTIGHNIRYGLLSSFSPMFGRDVKLFFEDPGVKMRWQVEYDRWRREALVYDTRMGPYIESETVTVDPTFQNLREAMWFGCSIRYHPGQVPDALPAYDRPETKRKVLDAGIPDPFGGVFRVIEDARQYMLEHKGELDVGPATVSVGCGGATGTDGPMTIACAIRGATEFCVDLYDDPAYARDLLNLITDATIARIRAWRRRIGEPERSKALGFADDSIQLVSVEMYREFVLPMHRRLVSELSDGSSPNSIHLCGDATRHYPVIRDELNVNSFDTGFPVDHGRLRRELGPGIYIYGGPSVQEMLRGTPKSVAARAKEILASGVMEGGRFVLREGNNLAPETPLENVRALIETARRHGRYGARGGRAKA
jgi:uroporphyrinogen-III decarboxylase